MAKYNSRYTGEEIDAKHGAHIFDSNQGSMLSFGSEAEKQQYLAGDTSIKPYMTKFDFQGTLYRVNINNLMGNTVLAYTQNAPSVDLSIALALETKAITDPTWSIIEGVRFNVEVQLDRGNKGAWETIATVNGVGNEYTAVIATKSFIVGANNVRIKVADTEGFGEGSITYRIDMTSMYLTDGGFNWWTPFYKDNNTYTISGLKIGGNIDKVLNIRVSNGVNTYVYMLPIGKVTSTVQATGFSLDGFVYPTWGGGTYTVELWLSSGNAVSETLTYRMMFIDDRNQMAACINEVKTIGNEEDVTYFAYAVYNKGQISSTPTLTIRHDGKVYVQESSTSVSPNKRYEFTGSLSVQSTDTTFSLQGEVSLRDAEGNVFTETAVIPVDNANTYPATRNGMVFYMDASGRSNDQDDKDKVRNEVNKGSSVNMVTSGISYIDKMDGWTVDNEGNKCWRNPARSSMEILYSPMAVDENKTIEFVYKISDAANDTDPIITILDSNNKGIRISPKFIVVNTDGNTSETTELARGYRPWSDNRMHVVITTSKRYLSSGDFSANFVHIYVNGVVAREFTYSAASSAANIKFGSNTADLYVYKMRVYNQALSASNVVNNYINSLRNKEERKAEYERIMQVSDGDVISYESCVANGINTMLIRMYDGMDIPSKLNNSKLQCDVKFNIRHDLSEVDEEMASLLDGSQWLIDQTIEGQGTTAMTYLRWNFRWKLSSAYGKRRITAKKNYASSMQSHKMGSTRLFNYLYEQCVGQNEVGGKVAVIQYPVYGFIEKSAGEYEFIGLYTVGADKGDDVTFGYKDDNYDVMGIEGSDHNVTMVGMDYPWTDDTVAVGDIDGDLVLGPILNNGAVSNPWEISHSADKEDVTEVNTLFKSKFKPAYDVAYNNSPYIKYLSATDKASMVANPKDWNEKNLGYEFWDDSYNLWYYDLRTLKYETLVKINEIGTPEGATPEEKNTWFIKQRRARFKAQVGLYWDIDDSVFHFAFCQLIGATDNFKKNTYPYRFLAKSGTGLTDGLWRWRQDDLDTIFDIDNTGTSSKTYYILVGDKEDGVSIYKGENSVFWTLIRESFDDEIKAMTIKMLDAIAAKGNDAPNAQDKLVLGIKRIYWDYAQKYFTPTAYNNDAYWSYDLAYLLNSTNSALDLPVSPETQSLGSHYETEYDWVYLRMIFIASLYGWGAFAGGEQGYKDSSLGQLSFRASGSHTFNITPSIAINPTLLLGTNIETVNAGGRVLVGEVCRIGYSMEGSADTNIYLTALDWYEDIGSLSDLKLASDNKTLSASSRRLRTLDFGGDAPTTNIEALSLSNCYSLEYISLRNCKSFISTLDLTSCYRIYIVDLTGSNAQGITLPVGSRITSLALCDTIATITFNGLKYLTFDGLTNVPYNKLSTLTVVDSKTLGFDMLKEIIAGSPREITMTIELDESSALSSEQFSNLYAWVKYNTTTDITGDDNCTITLSGYLAITGNVYRSELEEVIRLAGDNLKIEANTDEYYIEFADPVVKSIVASKWGNGVGITEAQMLAVTSLGMTFRGNTEITSFDELEKFENVMDLTTSNNNYLGVFYGCSNLRSIRMPKNLRTIQANTFRDCTNLAIEVEFPQTFIGDENFTIPSGVFANSGVVKVKNLGNAKQTALNNYNTNGTFYNCIKLTDVQLPNFQVIEQYAFEGCLNLVNVEFPSTITKIGYHAFYGCTKLVINSALSLPNLLTLSAGAFATVSIPTVTNLGKIKQLTANTSTYDDNHKTFGTSLESLTLPSSLETLGQNSVRGYITLTKVVIPDDNNIVEIGYSVFYGCSNLSFDFLKLPKLSSLQNNAFNGVGITELAFDSLLNIPGDSTYSYYGLKEALKKVSFASAKSVLSYAFYNYTVLEEANIPNVTTFAHSAFRNCSSLHSINVNWGNITTISAYAFYGCSKLKFEHLNLESLISIGEYAFYNVEIEKLTLGKIENISVRLYLNEVKEVVFTETLRTLTSRGFFDLAFLEKITLPATVESIPSECFSSCKRLSTINSENVGEAIIYAKELGEQSFAYSGIQTAILPNVETISDGGNYRGAFGQCTQLSIVLVGKNCTSIGSYFLSYTNNIDFICLAVNPPSLASNIRWGFVSGTTFTIYVPDANLTSYRGAENWSSFTIKGISELPADTKSKVNDYLS